ncbi:MAG TPA: radical SAM protein [Candidatus Limnocylindrales bacterium]|nr:radical SAM protein [Candidatus Limnocylindrales bacterium]
MSTSRSRYLLLSEGLFHDASGRVARLAYSTRRATLFAVDARTGEALERHDLSAIEGEQLARLEKLQAVVPDDEDELTRVLEAMRASSDDPSQRGFTIMPTAYCNMACSYCGQEHFKSSVRMQKMAQRVEAVIADPATRHVRVTWFGGEPMLALGVIRELSGRFLAATKQHGKSYSASMPTNGSLLTDRTLRVLREECALDSIEVTLDGPPEVHDRRRLKRNGTGSFHQITSALRDHLPPGLNLTIRVNIDSDNEDSVPDLIRELARIPLRASLALMPVHFWGNDVSDVEIEIRSFAQKEAEWLRLAESLGIPFGPIPNALKRTTCVATTRFSEVVDSAERVYSCSEHPLVPRVRDSGIIATVDDLTRNGTGPRPIGAFDDWYDSVSENSVPCGRCPILPICGGSCPKLWREGHIPCPTIKFNFQERLELAAGRLGFQRLT